MLGGPDPYDPPGGDTPSSGPGPGGGEPCYTCNPGDTPDCETGGGGSGTGLEDPNGCQAEHPEPCDTGNPILDDPMLQEAFNKLWKDSNYGSDNNSNPESQRLEEGGFIVPNGIGGHSFQPLKETQKTKQGPCKLGLNIDKTTIPEGAIYVHVHPYTYGERQYYCDTPKSVIYNNYVGDGDRPALKKGGINEGIIIDANGYTLYKATGNDPNGYKKFDRCGF